MKTETAIRNLNDQILEYEESGNSEKLAPLLAETFQILRSTGVRNSRREFLDAVQGNANRRRQTEKPQVLVGDNHALYTCMITTAQDADGKPNPGRFYNARLFILEDDGQWRCALWQVVKIP